MRPNSRRIETKAVLNRQTRDMTAVAHEAIQTYLGLVRDAVAHTAIRADASKPTPAEHPLGPDVNLNALDQSAAWPAILKATILKRIELLFAPMTQNIPTTPAMATSLNAWRAAYLEQRTQALIGVPDTITEMIRSKIQDSTEAKGTNAADAALIVKDTLNPDAPMWKSRAQTIARTEVMGANNQGALGSYTAIHQSLAPVGGQVYKTWLATEDSVTRPDHAGIDGTEIPISGTFEVGGVSMNGPHDNSAPGDEVINCRCTLTFRIDDGTEDPDASADDANVDPDALTAAAADVAQTGVAVLAMLSAADANKVAVPGGDDPADMHITLGYLKDPAASYTDDVKTGLIEALSSIWDGHNSAVTADVFGTAELNADDSDREPCAVVLVQSADMATLHDDVQGAIASVASDTFPIWLAHTTVGYNVSPDLIPAAVVGSTFTYDRLVLGWGDDQIAITSEAPAAAPAPTEAAPAVTAAVEAPVTAPAVAPPTPDAAPSTDTPPIPAPAPAAPVVPAPTPGAQQWAGPVLPLDVPSPDGRMFLSSGMKIRDLPLPISYQAEGTHGGEEAGKTVVVGRQLTSAVEDGVLGGTGDFFDPMTSMAPTEAIERVAGGIGFVSANIAVTVASYVAPGPDGALIPIDPMQFMGDPMSVIQVAEEWEYMGLCIVDQPAFGGARINLVTDPSVPSLAPVAVVADAATPQGPIVTPDSVTFPDGTVLKVGDKVNVVTQDSDTPSPGTIQAILPDTNQVTVAVDNPDDAANPTVITVDAAELDVIADADESDPAPDAAAPTTGGTSSGPDGVTAAASMFPGLAQEPVYPAEWFEPVKLDGPTHLTVTADGRVYGHLAEEGTCHIGFANECVAMPESQTNYAYFHVGEVKTTAGLLPVGKLTVGGGHADIHLGWRGAVEHYDNAGAAGAVVRAYRDEYGLQVVGALLPQTTGAQIAALRRNDLSGDWRPIGGNRELVAALSVNTAGFQLTPRAALAADGRPMALVAAGVVHAAPGEGEPEIKPGMTLPSGIELAASDVAVLAAAFAEVAVQRTRYEATRTAEHTALRRKFQTAQAERLRARLTAGV